MKILFIGDIFASPGRRIVAEHLQQIISDEHIDLAIANAENSAGGFGVTPNVAQELFSFGLDVLTTGNHVWDKREVYDYLNREPRLLRPGNYAASLPGTGLYMGKARNGVQYAVMNLQGRVHLPPIECPFRKADELLASIPADVKVKFLDFHAEVTSEKIALGWYLDGRITGMVGTHTHIPTGDARVLPKGTAYQTDCGMTGPYDSVIGVEKDTVIQRFLTQLPMRFEAAKNMVELHAVIITLDETTGRATAIQPYAISEE
ncbi:TIGR00282 family metallophosphoesterase [Paludibaculum fermentans]|uniref:TIGR00282 family metallophosphoesterase n=1 Tax=Paludibaculum fermentans TaxID=1473598 RepID=A0A7S7NTI9_PALFE|nr:TIGR00282 family metallophosphoesterase [Paludibaculum fermentans]QOY89553.1 TIGR00282 family metallophosphoesterase [Paludibaculum fermentans]